MNVLSLFDGISCARIALDKLGISVDNYFASEIDESAIKISRNNYPEIIHLGDIRNINSSNLPQIDLLIGGSPCQDLSNAQNGLGLEGSKSGLFYEYIRLLKELKPKYFLLENVKNKWGEKMSEIVGVPFLHINSAIFSAQSRPRYYWTNLSHPPFPTKLNDETIASVLETNVSRVFYYDKNGLEEFIKTSAKNNKKTQDGIIKIFDLPKEIIKDNERQRRVYSIESKSPTILARADTTKILIESRIRKLTPLECERMQKIPDNYTIGCSNTQRYKMIGNAFTVDVIEHFLKGLGKDPVINREKLKTKIKSEQLSLFI
jgi:DNA (cytosine-5)-methyltransferase 3A